MVLEDMLFSKLLEGVVEEVGSWYMDFEQACSWL